MNTRLKTNLILVGLIFIAIILAVRVVYIFLADQVRFPVSTVKIIAKFSHLERKDLEIILSHYKQYSFFTLPLSKIHKDLSNINWVKEITVQRVWPDTIKITVVEKNAVAIWGNNFLTEEGELYPIKQNQSEFNLPKLSGPDNHHLKVLQIYQKLSKLLATDDFIISSLELDTNNNWELKLTNGIKLNLGQDDIEDRFVKFLKAYKVVFRNTTTQNALVDLRFPHGMTIKWNQ